MNSRKIDIFIAAIALALFGLTNLPWQLDDYDQAKQAFTSFEMVKEGHWLYQRTPHERVATKPPLVGWISAGVYEVTRSWDVAWRLPSFGAAIALSILLYRAGGLIAFSAFAFNLLTPRLASLVRTDMPLALVVFAIGLTIWNHLREEREWNPRDQLSIFALLTAAMLIKGPIVYAFLLPALVFFWCRRERIPWWPWLASLGVFLAWVIGGCVYVPGFYDQVVVREFLGRFGETIHRPQPFWFYLPHLLHKFAPWSLLLIAVAVVDLSRRKDRQPISRATLWLICWSLGGLLVMSLIPSKRVDRIFPIIPPLCLLMAIQLRGRFKRLTIAAIVLSIFLAAGYSAFKIHRGYHDHRDALAKFGAMICDEASRHAWRYEVVSANDEGLLLYTTKSRFISYNDAIAQWKEHALDAVIISADKADEFIRETGEGTVTARDEREKYALIER